MSIAVKGYIQITIMKHRGLIALEQIESVSEIEGTCFLNVKYNNESSELDQSYDEVCALIKEARE